MGQAVADLPDPLQTSTPGEAKSADDLLADLARDEVDRLLGESDVERADEQPSAESTTHPAAAADAGAHNSSDHSVNLDQVLDTAVAERAALHDSAPAAVPVPVPVDNSPQIDLGSSNRVPLILRPLEWLSSPLDPWPDQLREILGKVGLMTLINALAVLAYVLLVRRHHH